MGEEQKSSGPPISDGENKDILPKDSGGSEPIEREQVPFPSNFTDTAVCDKYFSRYEQEAAKKIAERLGVSNDKEKVAGISIKLNQLYTRQPEVALSRIKNEIEGSNTEKRSREDDEHWITRDNGEDLKDYI